MISTHFAIPYDHATEYQPAASSHHPAWMGDRPGASRQTRPARRGRGSLGNQAGHDGHLNKSGKPCGAGSERARRRVPRSGLTWLKFADLWAYAVP